MVTEPIDNLRTNRLAELFLSKAWIVALAIVALGIALRLWGFDRYWLNPDEGIYFSMVTWSSWSEFWREYANNAHPPLFYLLLRLIGNVSTEFWVLRSVALFFGCAWVVAIYLLGREVAGRGTIGSLTGLVAALILALSPGATMMSVVMRPYTLQAASLTFGCYFLARYMRRGGTRSLPLMSLCLVLALMTHYSSLLFLGGLGTIMAGFAVSRRLSAMQVRQLAMWGSPVALTVVLIYVFHLRQLTTGALGEETLKDWLAKYMVGSAGEAWEGLLGVLVFCVGRGVEGPAVVLLVAGLGLALHRRRGFVVLLGAGTLFVGVLVAALHKYPFGCTRHVTYLLTPLILLMSYPLASMLVAGCRTAVLAGVSLIVLVAFGGPVSSFLGSTERLQILPELTLEKTDIEKARPALESVLSKPGLILLTVQSYYLLLPKFVSEREKAELTKDRDLKHFRWGKKDVLVWQQWNFSLEDADLGKPHHLYDCVVKVDADMPELGLGKDDNVLLIFGGWVNDAPTKIASLRAGGRPLARGSLAMAGLFGVEFDMAAYKAAVRATLDR